MQKKIINSKYTNEVFSPQIRIRSVEQMGPLSTRDTIANDANSIKLWTRFWTFKITIWLGGF
ncbi:hypothetical protein HDF26_005346 [Pedobacter cryoconitis]|nr:hypothetical protein [Pedobacter cryoconitis]